MDSSYGQSMLAPIGAILIFVCLIGRNIRRKQLSIDGHCVKTRNTGKAVGYGTTTFWVLSLPLPIYSHFRGIIRGRPISAKLKFSETRILALYDTEIVSIDRIMRPEFTNHR